MATRKAPCVDKFCIKPKAGDGKFCFHWVQTHGDNGFGLESSARIAEKWTTLSPNSDPELKAHFEDAKAPPNQGCGNPWNWLTGEETELAKKNCPEQIRLPVNGDRAIVRTEIVLLSKLGEELSGLIGADCWGVYTQDSNSNLEKTYFFSEWGEDKSSPHYKEEESKRMSLIDDPSPLLVDLSKGLRICVTLGCTPFRDDFFQILDSDKVIHTRIFHPMKTKKPKRKAQEVSK